MLAALSLNHRLLGTCLEGANALLQGNVKADEVGHKMWAETLLQALLLGDVLSTMARACSV